MISRFQRLTLLGPAVALLSSACVGQGPQPTSPSSPPSFAGTAAAPSSGWPTYHRDASRTGLDPTSPSLLPMRRAWASSALDGQVYAEPLVIGDRVFVATESDSVYALDATSGRELWRTHLGEAVSRSSLACGDIDPLGITGTPVADSRAGLLWVAPFVKPGRHELVALDLSNGSVRSRRAIDPPHADPMFLQQRAALAVSTGTVYVAFGGLFGDCGSYNGWVVGARADGTGSLMTYRTNTNGRAGIWGPSGPAIDAAGDLYVSTGNGDSTGTFDFGDAVVRLAPDLRILDWFAPANWADLNAADTDVGSMGPALVGDGLVFQAGKEGIGYLMQASHLGGINGQAFKAPVCGGAWGGTASMPPYLFVGCSDGLVALRIGSRPSFTMAWRSPQFWAEPPIVAGGLVWTIDRGASALVGFDAASGQERFRQTIGSEAHFATPAAANGRIFVPAGTSIVAFTRSA
jgi:outer membrane protein assembly factor BamB